MILKKKNLLKWTNRKYNKYWNMPTETRIGSSPLKLKRIGKNFFLDLSA